MGLPIAKLILLGHKGKINVRSKPNGGTRIKLLIPLIHKDTLSKRR